MHNADSAAKRYLYAAQLGASIQYFDAVLYTLSKLGSYYFNHREDFKQSRKYLLQATLYCEKVSPKQYSLIPRVYNMMGNTYFKSGHNDSAIWYYKLALHFIDSLSISTDHLPTTIYANMGSVLTASRQYRQGAEYIQKAISLQKKRLGKQDFDSRDSSLLASNYGNLGALYASFLGNMDSALYWWKKGIQIYRAQENQTELQHTYGNIAIGWLLADNQNIEQAALYLDTAIRSDRANSNNNGEIQYALAQLSYLQGAYRTSVEHGQRALALYSGSGEKVREKDIYEILSYSYAHLGEAENSRKYRRQFQIMSNQLLNKEITESIGQMEVQYRISEKDKELAQQGALLYRQRYWLTASLASAFLLALIIIGLIRHARQKRILHQEQVRNLQQSEKIEKMQVKMEAEEQERTRIARELHDGLGVLLSAAKINHNVLGKALPENLRSNRAYRESYEIIAQMQQEIKTIANNLVPDYIAHKNFEEAINALTNKFRNTGIFDLALYTYGNPRELHPDRSFALYRILEEIIHNTVKHAEASELVIQVMYHEDQLHLSTEDNGKGFDTNKRYTGIGLQSIQSRISMLKGYLILSSEPNHGTTYNIEVPYS